MIINKEFYNRSAVDVAKDLLGKVLVREVDGKILKGKIVETEAYIGESDKACHAYNGRRTKRTEPLYGEGGISYIYFIYGLYHCLNVVTREENIAEAVLIRALEPLNEFDYISQIRYKKDFNELTKTQIKNLANGPSKLCLAYLIDKNLNEDLFRSKLKECIEYLTTIQIGNDDLTDYFEYDFKDKKIKIPFKDILYIETVGSAYKLNLVGKNFQKEITGSLSDVLEKDVEERYFSPHQSFIVNRSMIIGMDKKKKQLLLKEGYSCPISRSNIKRAKKLIEEQNLEFSA